MIPLAQRRRLDPLSLETVFAANGSDERGALGSRQRHSHHNGRRRLFPSERKSSVGGAHFVVAIRRRLGPQFRCFCVDSVGSCCEKTLEHSGSIGIEIHNVDTILRSVSRGWRRPGCQVVRHAIDEIFTQLRLRRVGVPLNVGETGQLCSIQGFDLEREASSAKLFQWQTG